jgi:hypothetical protein
MAASKSRYRQSPVGIARFAWVNRPDVKYNQDGVYHTALVLEGEEADKFRTELDALAEEGFKETTADLTPAERKKWNKYVPYEVEEDPDNGNPTGRIIFKFKQNAKVRLHDGTVKAINIGIRDSKNKEITADVWGGSTIKVLWAPRTVKVTGTKQAGVRMDFCMVQLIKPADRQGGGGFDEVENGYVDDQATPSTGSIGDGEAADY